MDTTIRHHLDIHRNCLCHQQADRQTISQMRLNAAQTGAVRLTSHHIVFVLGGAMRYTIADAADTTVVVRSNEFIFMPASTNMRWEALEEDSWVLLFRLNDLISSLPECHTFQFQRQSCTLNSEAMPPKEIYPLTINARIRSYIDDVLTTEADGLKCGNYARHLVAILLTRIQVYYPQQEYMRFYSTVASIDAVFTDRVYEKWMECDSVRAMADTFSMTQRQFTKRFRKVFGEPPVSWMNERKKEHIYHDICSNHMPLSEVAVKHGFSLTNLVRYCRVNFGATPGAIRKNLADNKAANSTEQSHSHMPLRA